MEFSALKYSIIAMIPNSTSILPDGAAPNKASITVKNALINPVKLYMYDSTAKTT